MSVVSHDEMSNVDIRSMSINMLAKSHIYREVEKYNTINAPKSNKRKIHPPNPAFTTTDAKMIAEHIRATGLLDTFNSDPEQIDLLMSAVGKELHSL